MELVDRRSSQRRRCRSLILDWVAASAAAAAAATMHYCQSIGAVKGWRPLRKAAPQK